VNREEAEEVTLVTASRHNVLTRPVLAWPKVDSDKANDFVAEETPVALVYNGISHAVMMVSPWNLEAFSVGFSLSEGIVDHCDEIYTIDTRTLFNGIEISLTISNQRFEQLKSRRRMLAGRTGCGICGTESLDQLVFDPPSVTRKATVSHEAILRATLALEASQPVQQMTGAVHGAAWCTDDGTIIKVCEDIGRHNALDKLIGTLIPDDGFGDSGFLLISSRASYEILQKSARANIEIVVAVSAPTSRAIDMAEKSGITLVGFSREHRHVVYAGHQRFIESNC
jgi:formate dehydrogenase accessory protein FdhD